ncbi:MAG: tetraacyldisaccharide 4'-kinase [Holophagaceae bacterium]|nr:tetraacyldisaccharide 4'-kinase [Holophagaceae bacterium]
MSIFRWLFAPLAPFYGLIVGARNRAFDSNSRRAERFSIPVVSIGNLSVGGTGKTPLTMYLAQGLQEMGHPNVIISRGYGGKRDVDPMDVTPESNPAEVGDEPVMLSKRLGINRVIVARRRASAVLRAISRMPKPKLLFLDDGFQHRALHRDIDLLLLDGVRKWGNGKLLPLGNLREPMTSAKRAHALVVTRGRRAQKPEIEKWWADYGSGGPIFYVDFQICSLRNATSGERLDLSASVSPLLAFCAIGHPEAFFADLLVAGLTWLDTKSFRDHRRLHPSQIASLASIAIDLGAKGLICTEKDAVKLSSAHLMASNIPIWIAEQKVVDAESLVSWIISSLGLQDICEAEHVQ